jgi:hypothetical protein
MIQLFYNVFTKNIFKVSITTRRQVMINLFPFTASSFNRLYLSQNAFAARFKKRKKTHGEPNSQPTDNLNLPGLL